MRLQSGVCVCVQIRMRMHAIMRTWVYSWIGVDVQTYASACVHLCMFLRVLVCNPHCLPVYFHVLHVYMCACMHVGTHVILITCQDMLEVCCSLLARAQVVLSVCTDV